MGEKRMQERGKRLKTRMRNRRMANRRKLLKIRGKDERFIRRRRRLEEKRMRDRYELLNIVDGSYDSSAENGKSKGRAA